MIPQDKYLKALNRESRSQYGAAQHLLRRTVFVWILGLSSVISGAVNWQTGSVTLTSQVSAASIFPESSELRISSIVATPRKLIRRPAIVPIPLPGPTLTTPSVTISPPHTLIQRPSISMSPSTLPPATPPPTSVNLPTNLIRRPSVGPTSVTALASSATVPSVHPPQTARHSLNGFTASIVPSAEATASANAKSKNVARAAMATGSVTAPIFGPSSQSTLPSASANLTPLASVGKISTMPQSGSSSKSGNVRKLTQRPEMDAILAPPATSDSPPSRSPSPPSRQPPPSSPPSIPSGSGTATLRWNLSPGPNLAGYRVHFGTASGAYGWSIDVGNVSTYQVTGLARGFTYFFALTAYNRGGHESGFSNEASKSIY